MTIHSLAASALPLISAAMLAAATPSLAAPSGKDSVDAAAVSAEVEQAALAIRDYSIDRRDEAVRRAKAALDDIDARIERLEARLERDQALIADAASANARKTLRALNHQRNEVAEWYGGLKHSSRNAWREVRDGFVRSYAILSDSMARAAEKF